MKDEGGGSHASVFAGPKTDDLIGMKEPHDSP